ncbi:phage scaffolding protein [Lysinibacillus sp. FSL W8-0992]|uniref:phage scaffolding protein n=1 Tax=Lysinibacillus sp. FSL W8-0992 TaxID=2954643 RepID=UPI0030F5230A
MEWLKELLKNAGIADDQIETIVTNAVKEAPKHVVPKAKYNELSTTKSSLETQLSERDTQLEELKKVDIDGLQAKITELQQTNETAKQEHEQQMKDERLNTALKLALHSKVHDTDLVTGLIDKATIELSEDGKVTKGLDEQLKSLQESKSFLFVPEKQQPTFRGWNPAGGADSGTDTSDVGSNFAKIANEKGSNDTKNNPWD